MHTEPADVSPSIGTHPASAASCVRPVLPAMMRGALQRCPACGARHLFAAYLKVNDACPSCGEALHHQRADDAPPYMTIFLVGHVIVAAVLAVDMAYAWPMWLHAMVWLPLTIGLSLGLLPVFKGGLVGLQWALRMHGFGAGGTTAVEPGAAAPAVLAR